MIQQILSLIPPSILKLIHQEIAANLEKRGEINPVTDDSCWYIDCGEYRIKLSEEQDQMYSYTWSVYKDEKLISEGCGLYDSGGEAESDAMVFVKNLLTLNQAKT